MALDTLQTISARYSCRVFADRMPGDADLRAIAHAGISAPSAMNQQPWHVIVLKNRQLMEELEEEGMKNLASQPDKSIYARIQSRGGKAVLQRSLHDAGSDAGGSVAGLRHFDGKHCAGCHVIGDRQSDLRTGKVFLFRREGCGF